jgi:hypothetical protein
LESVPQICSSIHEPKMSTQDLHLVPLGHRAIEAIAASLVLMVLAIFLVAARFYTRRNIIKAMQSSDWIVLVSLVSPSSFMDIKSHID